MLMYRFGIQEEDHAQLGVIGGSLINCLAYCLTICEGGLRILCSVS